MTHYIPIYRGVNAHRHKGRGGLKALRSLAFAGIAILSLAGCAGFMDKLVSFDKALEPHTDSVVDSVEMLRCQLPLDVVSRAMDRKGERWGASWLNSCPEQLRLMLRLVTNPGVK